MLKAFKAGKCIWNVRYCQTLGIFVDNTKIHIAEIKWEKRGGIIKHLIEIEYSNREEKEMLHERWAEKIQKACMTEGLQKKNVVLCLPKEQIFSYKKEFPVMKSSELKEAIRWDVDEIVPFNEGSYSYSYSARVNGAVDIVTMIEVMEKSALKKLMLSLEEINIHVLGIVKEMDTLAWEIIEESITINIEDWQEKIDNAALIKQEKMAEKGSVLAIAAACYPLHKESTINLLPMEKQQGIIIWNKIAGVIGIISCLVMVIVYMQGYWQLYDLGEKVQQEKTKSALLQDSMKQRDLLINRTKQVEKKNKILAELSQQSISWRGIMVHLGNITVDNVWVTDMSLNEKNEIILKGKALNYLFIAEFLQKIEQDTDFFQAMELIQSESAFDEGVQSEIIRFSLKVRLVGKMGG
ncbi:MAG: PilN domain-containing protein [Selenomonadaceae bacterium]